jgi:hypothetical protein
MTHDELRRGVKTIGSQAAEGALVADGAARDRTKATFTRVQAGELAGRATHEAEKLADAQATPGLAVARDQAVQLAEDISDALGELQVKPRDQGLAGDVARKLQRLDRQATRLAAKS